MIEKIKILEDERTIAQIVADTDTYQRHQLYELVSSELNYQLNQGYSGHLFHLIAEKDRTST